MSSLAKRLPPLDGQALDDDESLLAASGDFGRIVHRRPACVVRPGSSSDVVRVVRFARAHGLRVAVRGRAHSVFGQAQVEGGIVLDMSSLASIHEVRGDSALVDGGCTWASLVEAAAARSLTPPALPDFLNISVGGTLSFGGIGGASFRSGTQTDNVLELEVVTGLGELVRCDLEHERELFDSVRAGLGQCGVIVRARVRLIRVPPMARLYVLMYPDLTSFLRDQGRVVEEERFDYVDGTIVAQGPGRHTYKLTLARQFEAGHEPDDRELLGDLACLHGETSAVDSTYVEFALRVDDYVAKMKTKGMWEMPHPWLDLLLPTAHAERFIAEGVRELVDERDGMVLTYILRRSRCHTPLMDLPDSEWVFLFDLLRNSSPPTRERTQELLDANTRFLKECFAVGGGVYPIGAMPLRSDEWKAQHRHWGRLTQARASFDPDHVFAPSLGFDPTSLHSEHSPGETGRQAGVR